MSRRTGFRRKIVESLQETELYPELTEKVTLTFRKIREVLRGMKIGAAGVDMVIGEGSETDFGTLGNALESIFRKIEKSSTPILVAIDEMPELLLALGKQEHGTSRVSRLLHWLRALRQTYRKQIRWIFLGSIGLDSFVEERNLGKTINDLTSLTLDALSVDEANHFLAELGADNGRPLSQEQRDSIVQRVGWPLPHHLQIVFHAMVDSETTRTGLNAVDDAFAYLLQPSQLSQFDTWRQRLDEQFSPSDASAAKDILRHLCHHSRGRTRAKILDALMSTRRASDPTTAEEQLARLLIILQRDGYLLASAGRYSFRSFLLREYWHRREIR
jgi:hypothetical protein